MVLLGDHALLQAGAEVRREGRVMDVAVGPGLLGRVVDPLGRPLDGQLLVDGERRMPIERPAPAIMDRSPVTVPLQTGLKVIDALIPIGRGQRELILGDRQTGKTSIAIDAIVNQRGREVVCVYCAIGQRASAVAKVVARAARAGRPAPTRSSSWPTATTHPGCRTSRPTPPPASPSTSWPPAATCSSSTTT